MSLIFVVSVISSQSSCETGVNKKTKNKKTLVTQNEGWILLSPLLESKGDTIGNYSRIGTALDKRESLLTQPINQTLMPLQTFRISTLHYHKQFSLSY